jgi:8-oxo-dGTP pyrophosphatase MutT (NUDIX family)
MTAYNTALKIEKKDDLKVFGVCCLISHANMQAFLVVHGPKGVSLPGGKREGEESIFETGSRELYEETGYSLKNEAATKLIAPRLDDSGRETHCIYTDSFNTTGSIRSSDEGVPYWSSPWVLLTKHARFPEYNLWLFDLLGINYKIR